MRISTLLLCLLCVSVSAFGQSAKPVNSVATIADLVARKAVNAEEIEVRNFSASVLWDQPRTFRHEPLATNAHDGVHYLTNAGASGRWVSADRLAARQNVKTFGAKGDGIENDSQAVQAAFNFAGSKMEVFFPSGIYLLDRVLVTNKNARMVGASSGNTSQSGQTTIRPHSTNYAVIFGNDLTRMEGAKIEGITFDGNGTKPHGLWINGGAYEVDVSSIAVRAFTGIGMLVGGNTNAPISLINFWNSRFDAYEGLSTAAVKIQQTTNWPTAFVTAVGFHGCHFDEAGADDGSQTLWIDSVDVFADWGTYFDLGEGGEGILFSKSVSAVAPKLKGDFVAETNGGGVLARADFTQANYRIGNLFPAGGYHLQGPVQWSDGTNITHHGRGWSYYQTFQDYPYVLGGMNLQDPDDVNGWDWNQKNQLAVTGGSLRLYSTTNQVYLLANSNSVVARTLSGNPSHLSLKVDATATPTNHALGVGGLTFVTGQGRIGARQEYPQADIVAAGGISAGVNTDPGSGFIQASKGFVVPSRSIAHSDTMPLRSTGHTIESGVTNIFLHQFSASAAPATDFPGASVYLASLIQRHSGAGWWNFIGGPYMEASVESTGSVGETRALTIRPITISSSGNVGSAFGLRIVSPNYPSTGVATNLYGLYIDNQTAASSAYAIYTGNGTNRFGDDVVIASGKGIIIGGVKYTNLTGIGGGIGGLLVASGDTNLVTNIVASGTTTPTRTNGTFAVNVTAVPANLLTGTIDDLRIPSNIVRSNDAAATYAPINNPTFTGAATFGSATIGTITVTTNLNVPVDPYAAGWASKTNAPTKKDIYDKLETLTSLDYFGNSVFDARPGFLVIDHLLGVPVSGANGDVGTIAINNAGQVLVLAGEPSRPGMRYLRGTGVSQNPVFGWASASVAPTIMRATNAGGSGVLHFEADIRAPDKSSGNSGTNIYSLQVGFNTGSTSSTNMPQDGAYLIHQTNLIGTVNWAFQCASNNTYSTPVDTGVAFTNSAWYRLGVKIDGTNAVGLINGTPVATNTSHVPFGRQFGAFVRLADIVGGTTLDVYIDKIALGFRP